MNADSYSFCWRILWVLAGWLAAVPVAWGATALPVNLSPPLTRVVQQYALTSANDFPQRDPLDWRLLASNDGGRTWTTLDVRTGEVFTERHQRRLFSITNRVAFSLYRLQIDRVRDPLAANSVQLAEIEPLGDTEEDAAPMPMLGDVVTAQGESSPLETRLNAFDHHVENQMAGFCQTRSCDAGFLDSVAVR